MIGMHRKYDASYKNDGILLKIILMILYVCVADLIFKQLFGEFILIPLLILSVNFTILCMLTGGVQEVFGSVLLCWLMLLMVCTITIVITFPITLSYIGIKIGLRKSKLEKVTYNAELGLEYFREPVKTWSPGLLNMIMTLDIDTKTSLAATLLDMKQRGAIDISDNGVVILRENVRLPYNERELLNRMIKSRDRYISDEDIKHWENSVIHEAIEAKLIKFRRTKSKLILKIVVCGIICMIGYSLVANGALDTTVISDKFTALEQSETFVNIANSPDGEYTIVDVMGFPEAQDFIIEAMLFLIKALVSFVSFLSPIILTGFLISYKISKTDYARTRYGNRVMEQAVAFHKFIHNFVNLSKADKDIIVIWGPYLVYSVAFRENRGAAGDVYRISKLNILR